MESAFFECQYIPCIRTNNIRKKKCVKIFLYCFSSMNQIKCIIQKKYADDDYLFIVGNSVRDFKSDDW